MSFAGCGLLFLAVVLSFVGTYQYIVPKFTNGAVAFATDDFIHKMSVGFVFTLWLGIATYYLAPYLFNVGVSIVYTSGASAWAGFCELGLLVFISTSICCGLMTWVLGKTSSKMIRCSGFKAAIKAGFAPGIVATVVGMASLLLLLSTLHFD